MFVYVDDMLIASIDDDVVQDLINKLSFHFKLWHLGAPKFFIGLEIARAENGIYVNQRKYTIDILASSGFSDCKPSSIPMEPNQKMYKTDVVLLTDPKQ